MTTNDKKAEQRRGFKEGSKQFGLLHARWPKAFPAKSQEIRPLTNGVQQALVEAFSWNPYYARGVLAAWKMRPVYSRAILRYSICINLDGSTSDEDVGDIPRAMAKQRLEQHAAQGVKKAEQQKLRSAATEDAQPQAPEPMPAALPGAKHTTATPAELPRARKLVVGSAAMEAALKRRRASDATTEVLKTVHAPQPDSRSSR
jgi:sRNA-binding protein